MKKALIACLFMLHTALYAQTTFVVNAGAGFSNRIFQSSAKGNQAISDYEKQIRSGRAFFIQPNLYFRKGIGLGLLVDFSSFSGSQSGIPTISPKGSTTEYISSDQTFTLFGLTYASLKTYNKSSIALNTGLGYYGFADDTYESTQDGYFRSYRATGSTIALIVQFKYAYKVGRKVNIGGYAHLIGGKVTAMELYDKYTNKTTTVNLSSNGGISMTKFDLGAYIGFVL